MVALNAPQRRQPLEQRLAAHAELFTAGRRCDGDVFWLKENAEFLNILHSTGQPGAPLLAAYEALYDGIGVRLGDFPQYYRFHLSICLDLEDLGMPGAKGAAMCRWAASQGLVQAELSDLQRAEARHLLARRGVRLDDDGLTGRLHRFVERSGTFALPNRKAAYELTHIVFYLSDYGRRDPALSAAAIRSLTYAGLIAFLDQNHDLLAEICVALRQAGQSPSPIWEDAVIAALGTATDRACAPGDVADDYHTYLVSGWLAGMQGRPVMPLRLQRRCARIEMVPAGARPLRDMSRAPGEPRRGDWCVDRWRVVARMDEAARRVLEAAERSTEVFAEFYHLFARTTSPGR